MFLSYKVRSHLTCYLLMLPTFALMGVFCFIPVYWAFKTSLFQYEIGGTPAFIGLDNYLAYFRDPTFLPSFRNMVFLTVFAVCVNVVMPLLIARLIFALRHERSRYIYRILYLAPIVVPFVATQMIWRDIIYSESGLLNECLRLAGLHAVSQGWLSNPRTVLWAIAFIGFPFVGGVNILIFYAGLANIPQSIHEASFLDGVTGLRKLFRIDIPLILSQVKLIVILTMIAGIQGFESIFIITRGGPGFNSMVPGLWMYFNAFSFQKMGMACAIGVLLFFLILALTILNLKYFRSSEEAQQFK